MILQENLRGTLMEELAEVQVELNKANRFGLESAGPDSRSNQERIIAELNDVFAMVELCFESGAIDPKGFLDRVALDLKKEKVLGYCKRSEEMGYIIPGELEACFGGEKKKH